MHSRTESGIPLDWQDVPPLTKAQQAEADRLRNLERVNEILALLDRQPTAEEIAAAQALLDAHPNAPQGSLKLKAKP